MIKTLKQLERDVAKTEKEVVKTSLAWWEAPPEHDQNQMVAMANALEDCLKARAALKGDHEV